MLTEGVDTGQDAKPTYQQNKTKLLYLILDYRNTDRVRESDAAIPRCREGVHARIEVRTGNLEALRRGVACGDELRPIRPGRQRGPASIVVSD
jgi:hypothetical protein